MTKWQVIVTRDVSESAIIVVQAETMAEANQRALEIADSQCPGAQWDLDDDGAGEPYLGDDEGAIELT